MELLCQIAIVVFGLPAIWLANRMESWKKWGCIVGMLGQPFWIYTTIVNKQYGMLFLTFCYVYAWGQGIYYYWIVPARK